MRVIHEYDCDFQVVGICTCGAINASRRVGGNDPGVQEHEANIKKMRDLQRLERDASALAPADRLPIDASPTGGATDAGV
jgi:hypothetical protein